MSFDCCFDEAFAEKQKRGTAKQLRFACTFVALLGDKKICHLLVHQYRHGRAKSKVIRFCWSLNPDGSVAVHGRHQSGFCDSPAPSRSKLWSAFRIHTCRLHRCFQSLCLREGLFTLPAINCISPRFQDHFTSMCLLHLASSQGQSSCSILQQVHLHSRRLGPKCPQTFDLF